MIYKAVIAFRRGGEQVVCVQAAMYSWSAIDNRLTRMITEHMLPRLDRPRIPLGGTSSQLRTAGAAGTRGPQTRSKRHRGNRPRRPCGALGHAVGVINSTTFEEANRAPGIRCDSVRDGSRATCRRCSCTSGTRFPHRIDRAAPDGRVRAAHRRCAADVPLHAAASRALRRVGGAAARDGVVSVVATMFAVRVGLRNTAVTAHVLSRWWR